MVMVNAHLHQDLSPWPRLWFDLAVHRHTEKAHTPLDQLVHCAVDQVDIC